MAETVLRQRVRQQPDMANAPRVRRRRPLPGGRAVVGGFLVALSAVGIFASYLGATADDAQVYVVADAELSVGHRIAVEDLALVRLDLPPSLRRLAYARRSDLVGAVVLGPVGRGELVQSSDVLIGTTPAEVGHEISFAIEAARAVDGQLRTGELIDVIATYGSGADAFTMVVARGARIANRSAPTGGLTGTGEQVVTLSVASAATTLSVAHAVNTGTLTLVRSATAADAGPTPDATTYRTPSPDAAAPAGPVPAAAAVVVEPASSPAVTPPVAP